VKRRGTGKIFFILVAVYVAALLPALAWEGYLDSPAGLLVAVPYLSIHVFHWLGVPGLLEHAGLCGWGWCAPTWFGWAFLALVWLGVGWLVAWLIVSIAARKGDTR
jgi:hypothetical protein